MSAYEDLTQAEQVAYWFHEFLVQVTAVCEHPDVLNENTTAFCDKYRDVAMLYKGRLEEYFPNIMDAEPPSGPAPAQLDPQLQFLLKGVSDYAESIGL